MVFLVERQENQCSKKVVNDKFHGRDSGLMVRALDSG